MSGFGVAAARDGKCQVNSNRFPIVVVPGIMGSRVQAVADGQHIWDPDDSSLMLNLAWRGDEAMRPLTDPAITPGEPIAQPMAGGDFFKRVPAARQQEYIRRGWGGPAWGFYGVGTLAIEDYFNPLGGVTYAFGYDWRASSEGNGKLLKAFIESVIRDQDAHEYKPIIVTHSMGGLVTRSCLSQGGMSLVSGVVHTFMPTYGAPEAYCKFRLGQPGSWSSPTDKVFSKILGDSQEELVHRACGATAVYELMPSHRYAGIDPAWLDIPADVSDAADSPPFSLDDPWKIYADPTGMVGLTRKTMWDGGREAVWNRVLQNIEQARKFHKNVLAVDGRGFHPITYNLVGDQQANTTNAATLRWTTNWYGGKKTDPNESTCTRVQSNRGDGTVAILSALAANGHAFEPHLAVNGVEHAAGFNNPQAVPQIISLIEAAMTYLDPWCAPTPTPGNGGGGGGGGADVRHENYTIAPGDWLSKISARYGMTYQELWIYRGDPDTGTPNSQRIRSGDPNLIEVGEVILVPKKS